MVSFPSGVSPFSFEYGDVSTLLLHKMGTLSKPAVHEYSPTSVFIRAQLYIRVSVVNVFVKLFGSVSAFVVIRSSVFVEVDTNVFQSMWLVPLYIDYFISFLHQAHLHQKTCLTTTQVQAPSWRKFR